MQKVLRFTRANLNTMIGLTLLVVLIGGYVGQSAVNAHHEPANKFAAAGAAIDDFGANADHVVLSETMKVSTPFDLALSATAECSILTYLRSEADGSGLPSNTTGRVEMYVTIDGTPVPVQTGDIDPDEPGVQNDDGKVTFCNRTYERRITDTENNTPMDGIDEERDFIETRTANAFNWFALDVGRAYDKPDVPAGAGNNIVLVELHARYTDTDAAAGSTCDPSTADPDQDDCSRAYVGKRTLVAEPTNASVHEAVLPGPGAGN